MRNGTGQMLNFKRGLQKALLLGLVGFLIPTVLLSIPWPTSTDPQTYYERQEAITLKEHLDRFKPAMIFRTGVHCAAVFALAAFAAYAPDNRIRFMRSLVIISSVTVLSLVIIEIFYPKYMKLHSNFLIDPGIPIFVAAITTAIIIFERAKKKIMISLKH